MMPYQDYEEKSESKFVKSLSRNKCSFGKYLQTDQKVQKKVRSKSTFGSNTNHLKFLNEIMNTSSGFDNKSKRKSVPIS
jgi:hypothetical protein